MGAGTCNVITLYKIDFGVGEDVNKIYVDRYKEKVKEAKEILHNAKRDTEKNIEDYQARINSNERLIKQYKDIIRSLEGENSSYKDLIKSVRSHEFDAEMGLRKILSTMIGKPCF